MRCLSCSSENEEGAAFCSMCGVQVRLRCAACGHNVNQNARFCAACGSPIVSVFVDQQQAVAAGPPVAWQSASDAERKNVSVLFADIVASFDAIANKDIEWIDTFLSNAIRGMSEAVHRYGGIVSGARGDGIMALFGAPFAREDHSSRACLAALAILDFAATESQRDRNLVVRVGIHSGEVIVRANTFDLSIQYDAVGETVHLAARMEQMAQPGTAFVTADTFKATEGMFRVGALGWMTVRGRPKPVEVYELLGAIPNAPRVRSLAFRGLSPFIGRTSEIALLQNIANAAKAGHGRIAAVVGEAGSGKSRLVEELLGLEAATSWHFAKAACVSYDSATDCAPFAGLLRRHLHLDSEYDPERLRKALSDWITSFDSGLSWLMAPLLVLFGADPLDDSWRLLAPAERRQQLIAAVSTALLQDARIHPFCIVLEDLHWSDVGTREVLELLVDALPTAALLCIVTYRPEINFAWRDPSCTTVVRLAPLEPLEARRLLQHILGDSSDLDTTSRLIVERAEGNPLFLEECVRSLADEGLLLGPPGAFYPAKEISKIVLPSTIALVVSQRIDLLDSTAKHVLQAASAIGVQVPIVVLADVVQLSSKLLRRALDHLCRAEFINQTAFLPEPEYAFRHVVLRDVAYDGLLREQRRLLHLKILAAMELRFAQRGWELAERFAHHAIASRIPEKAITYAQSAGRKSAARSACHEAVMYYGEALSSAKALRNGADRSALEVDLRLEMRYPLFQLGELARVQELMLEAESVASTVDDRGRRAQVALFLSHISWLMGRHRASVSYGELSAHLGRELQQKDLVERAKFFVGLGYMGLGHLEETAVRMRETADYFCTRPAEVSRGLGALAGVALGYLIRVLVDLGRREAAHELITEAKRVSESEGALPTIITNVSIGYLYQTCGQTEAALSALRDAYELCRASRVRLMVPVVQTYLGAAYLAAGDPQAAALLLREAVEEAANIKLLYFQPVRLSYLARAESALGRKEYAIGLAKTALRSAEEQSEGHSEVQALLTLAEICGEDSLDPSEQPVRFIRRAYKRARRLGLGLAVAECEKAMARFYNNSGDETRARMYSSRGHVLHG
jgi:class 3 adenylate cyclase/tetratricopeptide (TPR) repeat protein